MNERSVTHSTFVIERTYDASPARVFAAFASPEEKARWFGDPDHPSAEAALDFRVGGREFNRGELPGGVISTMDGYYYDIVPNERIVTTYEMHLDGKRISVSLLTIELLPSGSSSTHLILTEQGAYLDGFDKPEIRQGGMEYLMDSLGAYLQRETAAAAK